MARTTLRQKGQITLPAEVRAALHVEDGDEIEFEVAEDGQVLMRGLKMIPVDQAWFWTPEWQAGEREAAVQTGRGVVTTYKDSDAFLCSFDN